MPPPPPPLAADVGVGGAVEAACGGLVEDIEAASHDSSKLLAGDVFGLVLSV